MKGPLLRSRSMLILTGPAGDAKTTVAAEIDRRLEWGAMIDNTELSPGAVAMLLLPDA